MKIIKIYFETQLIPLSDFQHLNLVSSQFMLQKTSNENLKILAMDKGLYSPMKYEICDEDFS